LSIRTSDQTNPASSPSNLASIHHLTIIQILIEFFFSIGIKKMFYTETKT
jgi:hypothetical protein